jgi:hypothetical protein
LEPFIVIAGKSPAESRTRTALNEVRNALQSVYCSLGNDEGAHPASFLDPLIGLFRKNDKRSGPINLAALDNIALDRSKVETVAWPLTQVRSDHRARMGSDNGG